VLGTQPRGDGQDKGQHEDRPARLPGCAEERQARQPRVERTLCAKGKEDRHNADCPQKQGAAAPVRDQAQGGERQAHDAHRPALDPVPRGPEGLQVAPVVERAYVVEHHPAVELVLAFLGRDGGAVGVRIAFEGWE